ncbi:hypothetical protein [Pseudomonas sp. GL-B-16]|uniref:hypothetical protein n=1 Tax=Pseudomonas sp. GL-B-16 TaxID=2832373 RepID=UPI001CC17884|nr:hypothetical protein [Pseudomonas sp. GL-B-16]
MSLATASQIRRAYQRVLSRGLVATPRTVAQELGTGYSEASIAKGLELVLREAARQGDSPPASKANRELAGESRRDRNDQERIRQGEQSIRQLKQTICQITLELDACEQKSIERQTELDTLRQAAITTIASQQSQIKSLVSACDALTAERDQLHTRIAEVHAFQELHHIRRMLKNLYQYRLTYTGPFSHGITPWSATLLENWNTFDTPKIESLGVTLVLHESHRYEMQRNDKEDALEERHSLTKHNARLLNQLRRSQRNAHNMSCMYEDEHWRYIRLLREIRRFTDPNYLRNCLPPDEKGQNLHFQQLFEHMKPIDSTGTDDDE